MTLEALISRCETGEMLEVDFEHPLAKEVLDELAQSAEEERQAALFADVRKLSDVIIEQYLTLDREDKLKMAHVYQEEECFREIGGLRSTTKERLKKYTVKDLGPLGKENLDLLLQISNYSKLTVILARYIDYVESNFNLNSRNLSLGYYVENHDLNGKRVDKEKSMRKFFYYDFRNNCRLKRSEKNFLESLTYGVTEELKRKVEGAGSLLPLRLKILGNYLHCLENGEMNIKNSSLASYLRSYNVEGEKVGRDQDAMDTLLNRDFKTGQSLKNRNNSSVLESMTHGAPEELKIRVKGTESLLSLRVKILESYVRYIESGEGVIPSTSSLAYYLRNHTIKGEKVKSDSRGSLSNLTHYDFRKGKQTNRGDNRSVLESMIYNVSADLKKKVEEAESLLSLRIKILKNYLAYINSGKDVIPSCSSLAYYLRSRNTKNEKVDGRGKDSMLTLATYDFEKSCILNKHDNKSILESITYGVPAELKKKIVEAECLLPLRVKILKDYIRYTETDDINPGGSSVSYYLRNYNIDGLKVERESQESMRALAAHDFERDQLLERTDSKSILKSIIHGLPEELKIKVEEAESLLPLRKKILKNYVRFVETTEKESNIGMYMRSHNTKGEKVIQRRDSMHTLSLWDYKNNCRLNHLNNLSILRSFTHGIQDQDLVAKVRQYALANQE